MNKQKHRHLVALPIAVLAILTVGVCSHLLPVQAEADGTRLTVHLRASDRDEVFSIGSAVAGMLRSSSELLADDAGSRLSLKRGQVLLQTAEPLTLEAGDTMRVIVAYGAFVAVRDADAVTIAALDTPVLIEQGGVKSVLEPGRQVRVASGLPEQRTAIGSDWFTAQWSDLTLLPSVRITPIQDQDLRAAIDARPSACTAIADAGHIARSDLRSALATLLSGRRIDTDVYHCIRSLTRALDGSDTMTSLALLLLATEGGRTDTAASSLISEDFIRDPFLKTVFPVTIPVLAVTSQRPVQAPLIHAFGSTVIQIGLASPAQAIRLITNAAHLPRTLATAGLPMQSDAWKSSLVRAVVVLKTTVPDADRSALDAAFSDILRKPVIAAAAPVVVKEVPSTHWTEDELTAITRDILVTHGALLATTTTLTPDAETQTVLVEGVFIAEDSGNVPYVFTYNPGKERVTKIIRDGRRLPNAVPVQTFFGS